MSAIIPVCPPHWLQIGYKSLITIGSIRSAASRYALAWRVLGLRDHPFVEPLACPWRKRDEPGRWIAHRSGCPSLTA